jgi:predicted DsbA family dithiol-disulfide isomerase
MLESDQFDETVSYDIYESRQLGVQGVPFFVLERKFGISGAQPDEIFDQTLKKAWGDFIKENPTLEIAQGSSKDTCEIDGDC